MKMTKEKTLLVIVAAALVGVAAMDGKYETVRVPATTAPTDVPPLPREPADLARFPRTADRPMFDLFSDLKAPPLLELPEPPQLAIPVPHPPVRPYPHLDAARGLRHFFFDPVVPPPREDEPPPAEDESGTMEDDAVTIEDPDGNAPKTVDFADYDWVKTNEVGGMGGTIHGRIEVLAADIAAGKTKFDLVVDPTLEFTFNQVDKTGKSFGPVKFRGRTLELGFADTLENNFGIRRARAMAGRKELDLTVLRDLAAYAKEEAYKPRYRKDRRKGLEQAARCYEEVLRRNSDDKQTLKDLGAVYRLLQDAENEVSLYDWWLEKQTISRDPEILALGGEGLELLGLTDRARLRYEEALVANPDPRIRVRLGRLLLLSGSLEDARRAAEVYRRAGQEGERAAGISGEARALLASGDFTGAKAVLAKVTSESERDADWYQAMGAIHYVEGRLPEALSHFQAAFDRTSPATEARGVARTNLAVVKARQAVDLPEDDAARRTALEGVLADCGAALADDPLNYYWPLVVRGYALRGLGEPDKAVEALQEAVAAWPQEAYGRTLLGEFLLRDGRVEEARTQFLAAARLAPGFPDALAGVGRAGGGPPGEARDFLRRAMELEPKVGVWPLLSARALMQDEGIPYKNRLEEARRDLTYLVEKVDRSLPLPQAALGWIRYQQGDAGEALDRWNTARSSIQAYAPRNPRELAYQVALTAWLKESGQKVDKWQNTRIWRDEFDRPDGPNLGNLWVETEKNVKVALRGGVACIGPGKVTADEVPGFHREFDAPTLLKAIIEFEVLPGVPGDYEVGFTMFQGKNVSTRLAIWRTDGGAAKLLVKVDNRTKDAEIVRELPGFTWPENGRVSFGFVKMDEAKGTVALLLNGEPIPGYEALEVQSLMKSRGGKIRVDVSCKGLGGTEVRATVEAVEAWRDTR